MPLPVHSQPLALVAILRWEFPNDKCVASTIGELIMISWALKLWSGFGNLHLLSINPILTYCHIHFFSETLLKKSISTHGHSEDALIRQVWANKFIKILEKLIDSSTSWLPKSWKASIRPPYGTILSTKILNKSLPMILFPEERMGHSGGREQKFPWQNQSACIQGTHKTPTRPNLPQPWSAENLRPEITSGTHWAGQVPLRSKSG